MNNIEIDFGNDGFKIQAELKMDGNMWCVGIGKDIQTGVFGDGNSPAEAVTNFKDEFRNYKKPKMVELFAGTNEALASLTVKS